MNVRSPIQFDESGLRIPDVSDVGFGDELELYNTPDMLPQRAAAREYMAGVSIHGDGTDEFSTQKLVVERKTVYPSRQGIVPGMPEMDGAVRGGTLRNRVDLEHQAFGSDSNAG